MSPIDTLILRQLVRLLKLAHNSTHLAMEHMQDDLLRRLVSEIHDGLCDSIILINLQFEDTDVQSVPQTHKQNVIN